MPVFKASLLPLESINAMISKNCSSPSTIVEAARHMDKFHLGQTQFIIKGNGPKKTLIQEAEREVSNLKYLGWLFTEDLFKQYYLADLGLIQHKNSLTQTGTYKLFNYLSAGMPVLAPGRSNGWPLTLPCRKI